MVILDRAACVSDPQEGLASESDGFSRCPRARAYKEPSVKTPEEYPVKHPDIRIGLDHSSHPTLSPKIVPLATLFPGNGRNLTLAP
jgi:hypothetical protein